MSAYIKSRFKIFVKPIEKDKGKVSKIFCKQAYDKFYYVYFRHLSISVSTHFQVNVRSHDIFQNVSFSYFGKTRDHSFST